MICIIENLGVELSENDQIALKAVNKYRALGCIPNELYYRIIEYLKSKQLH